MGKENKTNDKIISRRQIISQYLRMLSAPYKLQSLAHCDALCSRIVTDTFIAEPRSQRLKKSTAGRPQPFYSYRGDCMPADGKTLYDTSLPAQTVPREKTKSLRLC